MGGHGIGLRLVADKTSSSLTGSADADHVGSGLTAQMLPSTHENQLLHVLVYPG